MNNFRKLEVWNKSIDLATEIYELTKQYPKEELYGLTSQIRRAVVSISSNIAEGAGRQSKKEFIHYLNIAKGSSYEVETQLTISRNLKFISDKEFKSHLLKIIEIEKMIFGLVKALDKE